MLEEECCDVEQSKHIQLSLEIDSIDEVLIHLDDVIIRISGPTPENAETGSGSFSDTDEMSLIFVRSGDKGDTSSGALLAANNLSDLDNDATSRTNLGVEVGVDVQAFDADTAKLDVVQSFTAEQTFKEFVETQFNVTGTTPVLDPANGTFQFWTLTANSTPTEALADGQSITGAKRSEPTLLDVLNGGAGSIQEKVSKAHEKI